MTMILSEKKMTPTEGFMSTVLVIDDEKDLLEIIEMELEMAGFDVVLAGGVVEAKEILSEQTFDVVLTDYRMPDGTGADILRYLHELKYSTPCFVITGFSDISPEKAYDLGAWGYFNKPTNLKDVSDQLVKSLQPVKERWSTKPDTPSKSLKYFEFKAYAQAMKEGLFRVEQGGFYILGEVGEIQQKDKIEFNISIGSESLVGAGIVRWSHDLRDTSKCYLGVEITYLEQTSFEVYQKILDEGTASSVFIPMHPSA